MKWNYNDTKYIIKRLVIYFLIAFAMFIFSTWKANAQVISVPIKNDGVNICQTNTTYTWELTKPTDLYNTGQGYVIFNLVSQSAGQGQSIIQGVNLVSQYNTYTCEITGQTNYYDNNTMQHLYNVKCTIKGLNESLSIYVEKSGGEGTCIKTWGPATYVSQVSEANSIVSAINNATQQQIINNNTNNESMQNAINNAVTNATAESNKKLDNINNSINNDNITSSDADNFKNNEAFSDSTGLESVINLPLNMVNSLSNECQPIHIHIPYIDADSTIPCMSTIYRSKFNSLYTLVKLVVNGFLVYRILLKVYELVHEAKQPDEDKLEVIEL